MAIHILVSIGENFNSGASHMTQQANKIPIIA